MKPSFREWAFLSALLAVPSTSALAEPRKIEADAETNGRSPFEIAVRCHRNPECAASGRRLPLRITITNRSGRDAYLTVDSMRETGPYTTITDTGNGSSRYGHTGLPSDVLLSRYRRLAPGESVILPYILYNDEIGANPDASPCAALRVDFDFRARWGWELDRGYSFDDKAVLVIPGRGRPGCGNVAGH